MCSGSGREPAERFYSSEFVDHVNDFELRGLEGVRRSVELYTSVLSNLEVTVQEQVVDGDRVTSRFIVSGTNRGRRVRFNGITISRFLDGKMWASPGSVDTRLGRLGVLLLDQGGWFVAQRRV